MWSNDKPICVVDLRRGNLPVELPKAVEKCLRMNVGPTQDYVEDLRRYSKKRALENQRDLPHLQMANKYVNLYPRSEGEPDWRWLFDEERGWSRREACVFIPGICPPDNVWQGIEDLKSVGELSLAKELEETVFDLIDEKCMSRFRFIGELVWWYEVMQDDTLLSGKPMTLRDLIGRRQTVTAPPGLQLG